MNIELNQNENLIQPYPEPYNGICITIDYLKIFIAEAINQNKQPIIIFGANWCPDARLLEGVLQLPSVNQLLKKHTSVLNIDCGNYEINMQLLEFFDPAIKDGMPRVFIMDLKGKLLNLNTNDAMRKARTLSTQEIFNYFQGFLRTDRANSENA